MTEQHGTVAPAVRPARTRSLLTFAAFAVAIVAAAAAIHLWQELRALRETQAARSGANTARLTALDAELAALDGVFLRRDEFTHAMEELRQSHSLLASRLTGLEEAMGSMRLLTQSGRAAWLRSEVKYLLKLANDELYIAGNVSAALAALRAADARLQDLADPALNPVRETLRREIAALEKLPLPDSTGMALALAQMAERIPLLPLKRRAQTTFTPEPQAAPAGENGEPSGWEAIKASARRVFGEMVTIRRANEPVLPLLPPEQEYFLYRNLELKLESARAALLRRDNANFHASLRTARDWVALHFEPADPAVQAVVADLIAMDRIDIAPKLPDITASLVLLRKRYPDEEENR